LHALAEGVADERIPVREACAIALCDSINDRHSFAVPPGILIDVLVHILSPVIRVLGDYLISDWNKQSLLPPATSSSSSSNTASVSQQKVVLTTPPNPASRLTTAHKGPGIVNHPSNLDTEWITIESTHLESLPLLSEVVGGEKGNKGIGDSGISANKPTPSPLMVDSHVILKCIETLTNVFMRNVVKLSHYPSFDKLWLQLLQIFTYFMEVSPVPSSTTSSNSSLPPVPPHHPHFSQAIAHTSSEISLIQQLSAFCYAKLQLLIQCLQKEKIFKKKEGLWLVTKDFLAQLSPVNILGENSSLVPTESDVNVSQPVDNK
jgi:hypothetical protein